MAQERFEEAIQAEQKALALDPTHPRSAYNIGFSQENRGKFEMAAVHYLRELRLDPPESDVPLGLARVHFKLKQFDTALAYAKRANTVEERAENYRWLYRILDAMGRSTEADEAYQRGLKVGIEPATNTTTSKPGRR